MQPLRSWRGCSGPAWARDVGPGTAFWRIRALGTCREVPAALCCGRLRIADRVDTLPVGPVVRVAPRGASLRRATRARRAALRKSMGRRARRWLVSTRRGTSSALSGHIHASNCFSSAVKREIFMVLQSCSFPHLPLIPQNRKIRSRTREDLLLRCRRSGQSSHSGWRISEPF